jgi:PhnB protein
MMQISPMLAVSDPRAAIDFYKRAFGAEEMWRIEAPDGGPVVCGMRVDGAEFFLASENPAGNVRGPSEIDATTVRIELFVDDPHAVFERAVAAGVPKSNPITEHTHATTDGGSFSMLQGGVIDPFGHHWLIGKFT